MHSNTFLMSSRPSWQRLALGTIHATTPADGYVRERCAAARAGFAAFAVHREFDGEIAAGAIGLAEIAQGGTALCDGFLQDAFDSRRQRGTFSFIETGSATGGVDAACVQRFGCVDVANANDVPLIHDVRFDCRRFAARLCVETGSVEGVIQRFDAQCGQCGRQLQRIDDGNMAEAARVMQAQFLSVF